MRLRLSLVIVLLLTLVVPVWGSIVFTSECAVRGCVEGTLVNFSVRVRNNLNESIRVDEMHVKDAEANVVIAFDIQAPVTIKADESSDFIFGATLSMPPQGYTWYYLPCFSATARNQTQIVCAEYKKSLTVTPKEKIECYNSSECKNGNVCKFYRCVNPEGEPLQLDWLFVLKIAGVLGSIVLLILVMRHIR